MGENEERPGLALPYPALPHHDARSNPPGPHTAPLLPQPGHSRRGRSTSGPTVTSLSVPASATPLTPRLPLLYCATAMSPHQLPASRTPASGFFSQRVTPAARLPTPTAPAQAFTSGAEHSGTCSPSTPSAAPPRRSRNYVSQSAARGMGGRPVRPGSGEALADGRCLRFLVRGFGLCPPLSALGGRQRPRRGP